MVTSRFDQLHNKDIKFQDDVYFWKIRLCVWPFNKQNYEVRATPALSESLL